MPLPGWLLKKIPKQENIRKLRAVLDDAKLQTVCEEAKCPNIGECYLSGTCTFIILGKNCTRNCAFCAVAKGQPTAPDPSEPQRIAAAVKQLNLKYVVITSVSRDDLPDGGASHFAKTIAELRTSNFELRIEILIPDFRGDEASLQTVLAARPFVLNHNLETVPRLYPKIRPQAIYERSLKVLRQAKDSGLPVYTKSGFMVGLGETKKEGRQVLTDLKEVGCDLITIGQYLPPSRLHCQPERYILPAEFEEYKQLGLALGFQQIRAGPFVRSSYQAGEILECQK